MTNEETIFDWINVTKRFACPICGGDFGCIYSISRKRVLCVSDATGAKIGDLDGWLHVLPTNEYGNPEFPQPSTAKKINSGSTMKKEEPNADVTPKKNG